jgi:hypothetical protein
LRENVSASPPRPVVSLDLAVGQQHGNRPEEEEHHPFEVDGQTSKEAAALTLGEVGD